MPSEEQATPPGNPFAPTASPVVPDHELLRLIGRGAYGEVWLARNAIGTLRAVKIVHRSGFQRTEHFEREFKGLLKFEPISRSHGGLVHVLQIGRRDDAGYFFYVMELADAVQPRSENGGLMMEDGKGSKDGNRLPPSSVLDPQNYAPRTLRSELETRGSLPPAECVGLGLKLASALEHLHANGLLHRDIKPSNTIFVKGEPKLADIGLVTAIDEAQSLVGTAGYIPPEGPGTAQADLYSMGKVLYEIAFGKDRQEFPQLPSDLQSHPDYAALLELNEVILKACETDPRQRYASASALREDLELLQRGRSVKQKRTRQQRWAVAKKTLSIAAVIGVLAAGATMLRRQPVIAVHVEKRSTNELANHFFDLGKANFDLFRGTNMAVAADYMEKAILADTNFAEAYGYLAATYFWGGFSDWNPGWKYLPQAMETALHALALDDSLAEPHLALGWYDTMHKWAWDDAEKQYKRGIQLNPSSAFCLLSYAEFLRVAGRMPEALKEINEAKTLDPHSRIINVRLINYLVCARRFNDALAQLDEAVAMEAESAGDAAWDRRDIFLALGQTEKAIEAERDARIAQGESSEKVERETADKRRAAPVKGSKVIWRPQLEWFQHQGDAIYDQAYCHAQLGEADPAFACLEKLLKAHDTQLTFTIMTDWRLDPIRSDPRFHAILKTMHLE